MGLLSMFGGGRNKLGLTAIIGADTSRFDAGISKVKASVGGMQRSTVMAATAITAAFTAAGIAVAVVGKKMIDSADELGKMADRTGLSTDLLQRLAFAAELGGTEIGVMELAVKRLSKAALDAKRGMKMYTREFDEMGVSVSDGSGKLKDAQQLFIDTITALSEMDNATRKAAIAQTLLGRSGTQLLPILKGGRSGLAGILKELDGLSTILDERTIRLSEDFNDNLSRIGVSIKGVGNELMIELMPQIKQLSDEFVSFVREARKSGDLADVVDSIASAARGAAEAFKDLVGAVRWLAGPDNPLAGAGAWAGDMLSRAAGYTGQVGPMTRAEQEQRIVNRRQRYIDQITQRQGGVRSPELQRAIEDPTPGNPISINDMAVQVRRLADMWQQIVGSGTPLNVNIVGGARGASGSW